MSIIPNPNTSRLKMCEYVATAKRVTARPPVSRAGRTVPPPDGDRTFNVRKCVSGGKGGPHPLCRSRFREGGERTRFQAPPPDEPAAPARQREGAGRVGGGARPAVEHGNRI